MPPDADQALLEDCLAASPGSWEAFVRRFAPLLAGVCRRALRRCRRPSGEQEVADMLQMVFLSFLEKDLRVLRGYRGQGRVEAYLAAVAIRRVFDDTSLGSGGLEMPGEPADPGEGPGSALESREAQALLQGEVDRLAPRARLALALQARGGSLGEIGAALGLSAEAAGQVLSRARLQIRSRLEDPRK